MNQDVTVSKMLVNLVGIMKISVVKADLEIATHVVATEDLRLAAEIAIGEAEQAVLNVHNVMSLKKNVLCLITDHQNKHSQHKNNIKHLCILLQKWLHL
jgi:hypothetical protein